LLLNSFLFCSNNPVKVEQLVLAFVQHGPNISDPAANQALALALAKLSQETSYMAVIEKLGLLRSVLELLLKLLDLHKNSLLLQESCCIAVCRIALRIDSLSVPEKERIAGVFFNMLETDDQYVLGSTISGIRALGTFLFLFFVCLFFLPFSFRPVQVFLVDQALVTVV